MLGSIERAQPRAWHTSTRCSHFSPLRGIRMDFVSPAILAFMLPHYTAPSCMRYGRVRKRVHLDGLKRPGIVGEHMLHP